MRHPDFVLYNATVRTMDPARPVASLVAVYGGRISFVGDTSGRGRLQGATVRLIDCQGGCLVPGFHDAHLHLLALAARLLAVDCSPAAVSTLTELKDAVSLRAAETPQGEWVRGWGYDDWALGAGRHPDRRDLDDAAPHHPVRLAHRSGHAVVLNSAALAAVGIARETPDPPEGVIERDGAGSPTGLLLEMHGYLGSRIPHLAEADLEAGLRRADYWLASHGITTVHEATYTNDLPRWDLLRGFKERGLLRPRVVFMPGIGALGALVERGLAYAGGGESLLLGPAKIMLTMTTGALMPSTEELEVLVERAHGLGFPVAIHAVEQEAVSAAATAIASSPGGRAAAAPDRIEHAAEMPPDVLERVVKSRATVVTNPGFIHGSGERYRSQVSVELLPWLYRIGSLWRRGVPVAFGSDAPVEMPDPVVEMHAAVTRRSRAGGVVGPEEGVEAVAALEAHTLGGAEAAGIGARLGAIKAGMAADLVLLDRDPTGVEPDALGELRVQMTITDGEVVWEG
jgi:predicted amidohydrolase YtcJ